MKNIEFLKRNLIAHRGVHNSQIPENTLPAFVKCMDKNYIIELDIHILTDNTIVVYHDHNLKKLTGVNKVIETLSYPQLSKIKINKKYTIPTLKQVMHIVDGKVPILIEIKDVDNNSKFEEELVKILDNYKGEFAIQSMNPFVIDWFYKNRKDYVIGLIVFNDLNYKLVKKYVKKIEFISVYKKQLPFKINKIVLGWTIRKQKEYTKYKNLCDNLICENIL
ncbi:MAG: glycerophosphodiester phosphodiesterase [Bacilli bacterium]|nr:glycerophosphodiester phosphodiesterase [Bacilli bacterium]